MILSHLDDRSLLPPHYEDQQTEFPEARPVLDLKVSDGQAPPSAGAAEKGAEVPLLQLHEPRRVRVLVTSAVAARR